MYAFFILLMSCFGNKVNANIREESEIKDDRKESLPDERKETLSDDRKETLSDDRTANSSNGRNSQNSFVDEDVLAAVENEFLYNEFGTNSDKREESGRGSTLSSNYVNVSSELSSELVDDIGGYERKVQGQTAGELYAPIDQQNYENTEYENFEYESTSDLNPINRQALNTMRTMKSKAVISSSNASKDNLIQDVLDENGYSIPEDEVLGIQTAKGHLSKNTNSPESEFDDFVHVSENVTPSQLDDGQFYTEMNQQPTS